MKNDIIKDLFYQTELQDKGYFISEFIPNSIADSLLNFYHTEHQLSSTQGGNFWSIYSQDTLYKTKVHLFIEQQLYPYKERFLKNYKTLINAFVAKTPGVKSSFALHQDTTAMDETRFSPLSIWIPLEDITLENGPLFIIDHTHKYSSLYRSVSIPSPFISISSIVQQYATPILLKKGQALFFDNRLWHFSKQNQSNQTRVVVVSGVMPSTATYINCYKNEQNEIEIFEQKDEYVLTNPFFLKENDKRPAQGRLLKKVAYQNYQFSLEDWQAIVKRENLEKSGYDFDTQNSFPIPEPN